MSHLPSPMILFFSTALVNSDVHSYPTSDLQKYFFGNSPLGKNFWDDFFALAKNYWKLDYKLADVLSKFSQNLSHWNSGMFSFPCLFSTSQVFILLMVGATKCHLIFYLLNLATLRYYHIFINLPRSFYASSSINGHIYISHFMS